MRKLFFILMTTLTMVAVMLTGCGSNPVDLALKNLSEVRYNIFSGENDVFVATFMSGERETPYVVNGICEKRVEFGMLTVKYKTSDMPTIAKYKLLVGDNEYSGELEYNNYEKTLMIDINKVVSDDAKIVLQVITDIDNKECNLDAKTSDMEITWRSALDIAINAFGDDYNSYIAKGKLNGEIYVKIITDIAGNFDDYYWYVSIVGTNGKTNSVIINTKSGEIIAKK